MSKSKKGTKKAAAAAAADPPHQEDMIPPQPVEPTISMGDIYPDREEVVSSEPAPTTTPAPTKRPAKRSTTAAASKNKSKVIIKTTAGASGAPAPQPGPIQNPQIANIILHLKCCMKDLATYNEDKSKQFVDPLSYNPAVPPDLLTYNQYETAKH